MAFVSTNTEITLVNSFGRSGAFLLPSTIDIPDRILFFKDTGNAFQSSFTVFTTGIDNNLSSIPDTFEDRTWSRVFDQNFDSLQIFAASTSKWYTVGGNLVYSLRANTLRLSTIFSKEFLLSQETSSLTVSSLSSFLISSPSLVTSTLSTTGFRTSSISLTTEFLQAGRVAINREADFRSLSGFSLFLNLLSSPLIYASEILARDFIFSTVSFQSASSIRNKASTLTISSFSSSNVSTSFFESLTANASNFSTVELDVFSKSFFDTVSTRLLRANFEFIDTDPLTALRISSASYTASTFRTNFLRASTNTVISTLTFDNISTLQRGLFSTINVSTATARRFFRQIYTNVARFAGTGTIQTYTVPAGVTSINFHLWGAGGYAQNQNQNSFNGMAGGSGGYVGGKINVTPGSILYIIVGRAGGFTGLADGGGSLAGTNAWGGGFSGIFSGDPAAGNVIAIAGGGSGSGFNGNGQGQGGGFPAGGTPPLGGGGGTQVAGGAGYAGGISGSQFFGGNGVIGDNGGGGGGGGWYGGGGGSLQTPGGGGSSTYIGSVIDPVTISGNSLPNTGQFGIPTPAPNEGSPYWSFPIGRSGQDGGVILVAEFPTFDNFSYIENLQLISTQRNITPFLNIENISSGSNTFSTAIVGATFTNAAFTSLLTTDTIQSVSTGISTFIISTLAETELFRTNRFASQVGVGNRLTTIRTFESVWSPANVSNIDLTSTGTFTFNSLTIDSFSTNRFNADVGFVDSGNAIVASTTSQFLPNITSHSLFISTTTFLRLSTLFTNIPFNYSTLLVRSAAVVRLDTRFPVFIPNLTLSSYFVNAGEVSSIFATGVAISSLALAQLSTFNTDVFRISSATSQISSVYSLYTTGNTLTLTDLSADVFGISSISTPIYATSSFSSLALFRALDFESRQFEVGQFSSLTAFFPTLSTSILRTIRIGLPNVTTLTFTMDSISSLSTIVQVGNFSTFSSIRFSATTGFVSTFSSIRFATNLLQLRDLSGTNLASARPVFEIPNANVQNNLLRPNLLTSQAGFVNISASQINASSLLVNSLAATSYFLTGLSSFRLAANLTTMSSLTLQPSTLNANVGQVFLFNVSTFVLGSALTIPLFPRIPVSVYPQNQQLGAMRFFNTGTVQSYVVPQGVTQISFVMWGAGGTGQNGVPTNGAGSGGYLEGTIDTTPGTVLQIIVGGAAGLSDLANGGGSLGGTGANGGGFTGIFSGTPAVGTVIAIAGGGGGSGTNTGGVGGGGGFPNGADGTGVFVTQGRGGTQVAGGTGATNGSQFAGGGANTQGGGGGGGWFGGGSGVAGGSSAGGGGGSSTAIASVRNVVHVTGTSGFFAIAPLENSPFYVAPFGRQGQAGLLVIGPSAVLNVSTPVVRSTRVTVNRGQFSTFGTSIYRSTVFDVTQNVVVNNLFTPFLLSRSTEIFTRTLSSIAAQGRNGNISSFSTVTQFGTLGSVDDLQTPGSTRFNDSYMASLTVNTLRSVRVLVDDSMTISSIRTSTFTVSSLSAQFYSTTLITRIQPQVIRTSTMTSLGGTFSTLTLQNINGVSYSNLFNTTAIHSLSTGILRVSSMKKIQISQQNPLWLTSGYDIDSTKRIKFSRDGIDWYDSGYSWDAPYANVIYFDSFNFYLGATFTGFLSLTTSNASSWNLFDPGIGYNVGGFARTNNVFVAAGQDYNLSSRFTRYFPVENYWLNNSIYLNVGNGLTMARNFWVAVGISTTFGSNIMYSGDGSNWLNAASGLAGSQKVGISYNGYVWLTSGGGTTRTNRIQYSFNAINWCNILTGGFDTDSSGIFGSGNQHIGWNGIMWIVVGADSVSSNTIQYSYDGSNFFPVNSGAFRTQGMGVAWNGDKWVAVGDDSPGTNTTKYSYDGLHWLNADSATFIGGAGYSVGFNSNTRPSFYQSSFLEIQSVPIPSFNNAINKISFSPNSLILTDTVYVTPQGVGINRGYAETDLDVNGVALFTSLSSQQVFTSSLTVSSLRIQSSEPFQANIAYTSSLVVGDLTNPLGLVPTSNIRLTLFSGDAYKPTGSTWNTTSDERIKENIRDADLEMCYSNFQQIPLRRFTYKEPFVQDLYDKYVLGFVAQEVEEILPKAVTTSPTDVSILNIDQLNMIRFGALQKTIFDTELLKSTTFSLFTLTSDMLNRVSTFEGRYTSVLGNI